MNTSSFQGELHGCKIDHVSNIAPKITAKSDEFLLQYIQNTLPSQHNLNLVVGLISLSGTHVLYLDVLNIIGGLLIRAVVVLIYYYKYF